eukprot:TRINITY_DN4651_c0_g2_i1.p1 TRINITY_DN4651_c0_g2~~TRINITY_DN4651_c0_g2_i1.p1  ORF type:complete len:159 (-),score=14.81 TRINITY_DN4651_c0_g2_i1:155-631(-)
MSSLELMRGGKQRAHFLSVCKVARVEALDMCRYLGPGFCSSKRFTLTVRELCSRTRSASFCFKATWRRISTLGSTLGRFASEKHWLFAAVAHCGCEVWCPGILVRGDDAGSDIPEEQHTAFLAEISGFRRNTPPWRFVRNVCQMAASLEQMEATYSLL